MMPLRSVSKSGMKAATDILRVSANNVANVNTDGFKKDVVHMRNARNGGVHVSISKSNGSKNAEGKNIKKSDVNQVEESVNQIVAGHQFTANRIALKTGIETEGELLDILA